MGLNQFLSSVHWEQEAYPQYQAYAVLPFFVLFFPIVRFFLDQFVFEKLGKQIIFGKGHRLPDVKTDDQKRKIRKIKESAWKCIHFLSAELLALSVTIDEPWFTNTKYFWVGPGDQIWPDQKTKYVLMEYVAFSCSICHKTKPARKICPCRLCGVSSS